VVLMRGLECHLEYAVAVAGSRRRVWNRCQAGARTLRILARSPSTSGWSVQTGRAGARQPAATRSRPPKRARERHGPR